MYNTYLVLSGSILLTSYKVKRRYSDHNYVAQSMKSVPAHSEKCYENSYQVILLVVSISEPLPDYSILVT